MKAKITLTILILLGLISLSEDFGFAQQSTELTVPEGTIVHLAEEPINDIAYSLDGELLAVASGVYFYTLTAGDFSATRKMLILK